MPVIYPAFVNKKKKYYGGAFSSKPAFHNLMSGGNVWRDIGDTRVVIGSSLIKEKEEKELQDKAIDNIISNTSEGDGLNDIQKEAFKHLSTLMKKTKVMDEVAKLAKGSGFKHF